MPHSHSNTDVGNAEHASNRELLASLRRVQAQMNEGSRIQLPNGVQLHPSYGQSAKNLLGYLCLRRHDIRPLQSQLACLGLSSLAGSEAHVLNAMNNVVAALSTLVGEAQCPPGDNAPNFTQGRKLLHIHAEALLGPEPKERAVRIMVTLPDDAADDDASLVRDLVAQGMDCARINCAHGDAESWRRMAEHVRLSSKELGRPCKVMMDLAGPKLRTGDIEPGCAVLKIKPERDEFGCVRSPARLWLASNECTPSGVRPSPWVEVPAEWIGKRRPGDRLGLRDARGSKRVLIITEAT